MKSPPSCRVAMTVSSGSRGTLMNASAGMGAELKRIRATSQSLNHEGAARSRIFRVKHLEYTLFGGSLLF